nr:hypothetical protein [Paraburkholderia sp. J7]
MRCAARETGCEGARDDPLFGVGQFRKLFIPPDVVRIGLGLEANDVYGEWAQLSGIGDSGCLLVRPDRHIAFLSAGRVDDPESTLESVLKQILAL